MNPRFDNEPAMPDLGSAYLRIVGPTYGFFSRGLLRLLIAVGGGWPVLSLTGSSYGATVAGAIASDVWFKGR